MSKKWTLEESLAALGFESMDEVRRLFDQIGPLSQERATELMMVIMAGEGPGGGKAGLLALLDKWGVSIDTKAATA